MPNTHDAFLPGPKRGSAIRPQEAETNHQENALASVIDDAVLDDLADRLADRLAARLSAHERQEALVDAREIARVTGKTRRWVYDHARELGAVPLGSGPRPRLGFPASSAITRLQAAPKTTVAPPLPLHVAPRRGRGTTGHSRTVQELLKGPQVVVGARTISGRRG